MRETPPAMTHDVFICHPGAERARGRALREALSRAGVTSFLAELDLLPGDIWDEAIPAALRTSRLIAILLPARGTDWWQRAEIASALDQLIAAQPTRVVPVYLEGARPATAPYGLNRIVPVYWQSPEQVADELAHALSGASRARAPDVSRVTDSGDHILIDDAFVRFEAIDEQDDTLSITTRALASDEERALREALRHARQHVIAYHTRVVIARLVSSRISHRDGQIHAQLTLQIEASTFAHAMYDIAWGGPNPRSADAIAELRARRILLAEAPTGDDGMEMLVRGMGRGVTIDRSPLPDLLARPLGDGLDRWQRVRLALLDVLVRSNCVEQVDHLHLHVERERLTHIDFRGARSPRASDAPPVIIEVRGAPAID